MDTANIFVVKFKMSMINIKKCISNLVLLYTGLAAVAQASINTQNLIFTNEDL